MELGNEGTEQDFIDSLEGEEGGSGKSAYETWLSLGNTGTEQEFIDSLKGSDGETGSDGEDGNSAYETWLELGNTGSEEDFINSLKGTNGNNGEDGTDGKSAYEIWLSLGNEGAEEDFINSLKGSNAIDDEMTSDNTTWSSEKIKTELDGVGVATITSIAINDVRHLILYMSDGTEHDAGLLNLEEDYTVLSNIPKINGTTIIGDVSLADIGIHEHSNLEVLEGLSTDGQDLFFKGVNVTNILLGDEKRSYPVVILDAKTDSVYQINISSKYKECDLVVQTWKFVEGDTDVVAILKYFDNTNKGNFYCSDNVVFAESCGIKDDYVSQAYTVDSNGLYVSETINLSEFKEISLIK